MSRTKMSRSKHLKLATSLVAGAFCATGAMMALANPASAAAPAWVNDADNWVAVGTQAKGSYGEGTGRTFVTMIKSGGSGVGTKINIGSFPAGTRVVDQSSDGRRLALIAPAGKRDQVIIYDSVTKTSHNFYFGTAETVRFTNPSGQAILTNSASSPSWQRRSFNGAVQATFTHAKTAYNAVQTPDGGQLVGQSADNVLTVSSNANGALVRSTKVGDRRCNPARSLTSSAATVSCVEKPASMVTNTNVYSYSTTTGAFTSLSKNLPPTPAKLGYWDAQYTAYGLAVARTPGCGGPQWGLVKGATWTALANNGGGRAVLGFQNNGQRMVVSVGDCAATDQVVAQGSRGGAVTVLSSNQKMTITSVVVAQKND